jgi:hypothetical protein
MPIMEIVFLVSMAVVLAGGIATIWMVTAWGF